MSNMLSKEEWIMHTVNNRGSLEMLNQASYHDFQGVDFLSPIIAGYISAPVALYNGEPIQAQTVLFDDIKEVLDSMMINGDRILMYMLIYCPSIPIYSEINQQTFDVLQLDRPVLTKGTWRMRFAKA